MITTPVHALVRSLADDRCCRPWSTTNRDRAGWAFEPKWDESRLVAEVRYLERTPSVSRRR